MNGNLFGARQTPTVPTTRRKGVSGSPYGPDVMRVIEGANGPFRWLAGVVDERPHVVVQLVTGEYRFRFVDRPLEDAGELRSYSHEQVENVLRSGKWRVIS